MNGIRQKTQPLCVFFLIEPDVVEPKRAISRWVKRTGQSNLVEISMLSVMRGVEFGNAAVTNLEPSVPFASGSFTGLFDVLWLVGETDTEQGRVVLDSVNNRTYVAVKKFATGRMVNAILHPTLAPLSQSGLSIEHPFRKIVWAKKNVDRYPNLRRAIQKID